MLFFHYLAYQLFGAQPHAYHGITVFWHALSGCGLYTILRSYYTLQISLFLVFAFLFHPALTPAYIGVTSHVAPTYPLLIGSVIAYLYTQKKQKKSFLLLALFCFFASLTCYEIAAVLPLLFFSYEFFWPALQKKKNQEQKNRSLNNNTSNPMLKKRAVNALRKSAPFWATLAVYLLTRALLIMQAPVNALPISTSEMHSSREVIGEQLRSQSSKTLTYQVLFWLKKIAHNSRQALRPLWGCPQTSPLVPAGITFLYALLFLFTFISAPYKRKRLLWCLFCGIIAAWPLFIVTADGRYLYAALPFFLVTLYELFKTIQHYRCG